MSETARFCSKVSDAKNRSTAISPIAAPTVRVTFMGSPFQRVNRAIEQRICPPRSNTRKPLQTYGLLRTLALRAKAAVITVLRVDDGIVLVRLCAGRT